MWVGERLLSAEFLFKSLHDPFLKMYYEFMIWIFKEEIAGITSFDSSTSTVDLPHLPLHHRKSRVVKATLAYIAGFVANSLLKKYENCNMCGEMLLASDGTAVPVEVIEARTYSASHLTKPGTFLYRAISEATSRLHSAIGRMCCKPNLATLLKNIVSTHINFAALNCPEHSFLGSKVLDLIIKTLMYALIKQINLILNGKNEKFYLFMKTKPDPKLLDPVKFHARNMYLKKLKRKK
jgi:hypothetical protein